jgi:hypothetical protein
MTTTEPDHTPAAAERFPWIPSEHTRTRSNWELVDDDGALEYADHLAAVVNADDRAEAAPAALTGTDETITSWIAEQARRQAEARRRAHEAILGHSEGPAPSWAGLYGASRTDAALAVQAGTVCGPRAGDPAGGFTALPASWKMTAALAGMGGAVPAVGGIVGTAAGNPAAGITYALLGVAILLVTMIIADTATQAPGAGPQLLDDTQTPRRGFTGGHNPALAALMRRVHHATATSDHGGADDPLWGLWESLTALADEASLAVDNASRDRYNTALGDIVDEIEIVLESRAAEAAGDRPTDIIAELDTATAELPASPLAQAELQAYLDGVTSRARVQADEARTTDGRW